MYLGPLHLPSRSQSLLPVWLSTAPALFIQAAKTGLDTRQKMNAKISSAINMFYLAPMQTIMKPANHCRRKGSSGGYKRKFGSIAGRGGAIVAGRQAVYVRYIRCTSKSAYFLVHYTVYS